MKRDLFHVMPVVFTSVVCFLVFLAAVTPGCITSQNSTLPPASSDASILVYSGAGLKAPMQEIGEEFARKFGVEVQYNYGGSGTLISQMNLTKKGDIFIPGSSVEYRIAQNQGLVNPPLLVAYHVPVIAVQKGNPKSIGSIMDFTLPGMKVALGDANATAIGKAGTKIFGKYNITEAVEKNVITRTPTINELTIFMNTGQADVSLLTLDQINEEHMDAIPIPISDNVVLIVPVGTTSFTKAPVSAQKFADFVASDEGKAIFAKHGFPSYPDPAYAGVQP